MMADVIDPEAFVEFPIQTAVRLNSQNPLFELMSFDQNLGFI